jgi:hypothetical protein
VRVFEMRVLRMISGRKREEVVGGWRKLRNERLHNFCSSPGIILLIKSWRMRWAWHVARMGKKRNARRILVENSEGMRPLGKPICRWEDKIKVDLRAYDKLVWTGLIWLTIETGEGLLRTR